jgi:hypothetical protein
MKLSPEQIAFLRNCILAQVARSGSFGLPLSTLIQGARMAGFGRIEGDELDPHLHFLVSDGKLSVAGAAVSAALKRWTITAEGMRYAESEGLT